MWRKQSRANLVATKLSHLARLGCRNSWTKLTCSKVITPCQCGSTNGVRTPILAAKLCPNVNISEMCLHCFRIGNTIGHTGGTRMFSVRTTALGAMQLLAYMMTVLLLLTRLQSKSLANTWV